MRKIKTISVVLLLLALPLLAFTPVAQAGEKARTEKEAAKPAAITYKPPLRGAPAGRVGGGTRGTDRESFQLMVLAPNHAGQTVSAQPTLYWYISKVTTYPVELTITERGAEKPLLEEVIKGPERGGIQAVRLADHGVALKKNTQYKWFVTLVTDSAYRSKDILAGGIITPVDAPESVAGKEDPYLYAQEGLWYDAFDALSERIEAEPGNTELRMERAALLEQVGLKEVADFEAAEAQR